MSNLTTFSHTLNRDLICMVNKYCQTKLKENLKMTNFLEKFLDLFRLLPERWKVLSLLNLRFRLRRNQVTVLPGCNMSDDMLRRIRKCSKSQDLRLETSSRCYYPGYEKEGRTDQVLRIEDTSCYTVLQISK